jgi:glycosyltransferase involved in cell wall biosynthesis
MKLLMIGTDRRAFLEDSDSRARLRELASRLDFLTVIIFSRWRDKLAPVREEKLVVYPTSSWSRWLYPWSAYWLGRRLSRPDLITAQDPFETGLAAQFLARRFRRPWQAQIHTSLFDPYFQTDSFLNRLRVWLARRLLPQAAGVRVVSQQIADSLAKEKVSLKADPVILPVFVDAEQLKNATVRFNLRERYPKFSKIILMLSRLSREKNITLALESFVRLLDWEPGAGLIIVGSGPIETVLRQRVADLDLAERVVLVGWSDDLSSYYRGADVFLLTSRYEGFNRTLLEARLFGLPTVSTKVGGAAETGARMVAPESEAIARALKDMLASPPPLPPLEWWSKDRYWVAYLNALTACLK